MLFVYLDIQVDFFGSEEVLFFKFLLAQENTLSLQERNHPSSPFGTIAGTVRSLVVVSFLVERKNDAGVPSLRHFLTRQVM